MQLRRSSLVASVVFLSALAACSEPGGRPAGTSGAAGAGGTGGAGTTGTAGTGAAGVGAAGTGEAGASGTGVAGTGVDAGPATDATVEAAPADSAAAGGPGTMGDGDYMIGPTLTKAPEYTVDPNVPHGTVTAFTIASSESPIFPGVTGAYTRQAWIYIPKQYVKGTPAPFIIAQDGRDYMSRLPVILDNMIAAKRVPVMIAIMAMAGPGDGAGSERGWEYDTVSDDFTNWVETCVLPKMEKNYGVKFTTNPEGRASMGGSSGGSAAFTMGWRHPELYRRILTFSGSFTSLGKTADFPNGAWVYPEHLVADTPMKSLRVWLEAAEHDAGATNTEASMRNWIIANMKMAAALKAQGYHYHYDYVVGAQHNDPKVWDATLPGALEWLWRGYPID